MKLDLTGWFLILLSVAVGVVAGHFLWPATTITQSPVTVINADSAKVDSLEWVLKDYLAWKTTSDHNIKDLRKDTADAHQAVQYWSGIADEFRVALAHKDSLFSVVLRGDTTVSREDTSIVRYGDSAWTFINPKILRAQTELDLVSRKFSTDINMKPSTVYFGVIDTIKTTLPSTKKPIWWEAFPVVGGGLIVVSGYEKTPTLLFVGLGLIVVDVVVRLW